MARMSPSSAVPALAPSSAATGNGWRALAEVWNPLGCRRGVQLQRLPLRANGLTCSFDGSESSDRYGTISNYAWSFGDGTTGSGATISHTYAVGGAYSVTLTVSDGNSTGTKFQ